MAIIILMLEKKLINERIRSFEKEILLSYYTSAWVNISEIVWDLGNTLLKYRVHRYALVSTKGKRICFPCDYLLLQGLAFNQLFYKCKKIHPACRKTTTHLSAF